MIGKRRYRELASRLASIETTVNGLAAQLPTAPQEAKPSNTEHTSDESHQRESDILKQLGRIQDILQVLYDREPEMRERLRTLRGEPAYEQAFYEDEPLVSVVIPTYDRGELLIDRAIPSALAQSYENIEIVVVGDCAPADTGRRLAELNDPRISYENLSYRGPYPQDPRDLWHVAGIPPRNIAVTLARGSWIAPLDDDDAFHSYHIEHLLELARRERQEVAYGRLRCLMNDGSEFPLGVYPPELGQFGWQSAIFHAGLRFFEMELADALFFSPADWSLCRRMLRVGVRFGFLDHLVTDHYESRFSVK
jgi:O-antigen biosynthesis protein